MERKPATRPDEAPSIKRKQKMISLCLYRPDIPQNLGTLIRMTACFGMKLHIIKPCAFPLSKEKLVRSAMDYMDHADIIIHEDETVFLKNNQAGRLILMTTKAHMAYTNFAFRPNDMIIAGRESAGVPEEFARKCDGLVRIPMRQETRSLNVAISAGMVIGEAMRQTDYQTQASLF